MSGVCFLEKQNLHIQGTLICPKHPDDLFDTRNRFHRFVIICAHWRHCFLSHNHTAPRMLSLTTQHSFSQDTQAHPTPRRRACHNLDCLLRRVIQNATMLPLHLPPLPPTFRGHPTFPPAPRPLTLRGPHPHLPLHLAPPLVDPILDLLTRNQGIPIGEHMGVSGLGKTGRNWEVNMDMGLFGGTAQTNIIWAHAAHGPDSGRTANKFDLRCKNYQFGALGAPRRGQ